MEFHCFWIVVTQTRGIRVSVIEFHFFFIFARFSIDNFYAVILQWTILALRNLCEGNPENQEIIKNCKKTGVPDNPALQEMGLTLHEDADGKLIRIVPLRRN